MKLHLDPALRTKLHETAQALYHRDETSTLNCLSQISSLSPRLEKMIYHQLQKLTQSSTKKLSTRAAFANLKGHTGFIRHKIQAVETILSKLIHNTLSYQPQTKTQIPNGVIRVKNDLFFDCGFDPRFSEDGKFYLNPTSSSLSDFMTTIRKMIASVLFKLNAYLSANCDERHLRQLILSCSEIEKAFAASTYNEHMICSYPSVRSVPEHAFFERISDLYKAIFPNKSHTHRLFPSEVLHAIHSINKPQKGLSCPAKLATPFIVLAHGKLSRWINGDLDRSSHWGLFRLCKSNFEYSTSKGTQKLDRLEYGYVPHYLMVHAIEESSKELKRACRAIREALSKITCDMSFANSLENCKQNLIPLLHKVKQSWDNYVQSHEQLNEVQTVFSQKDHYAPVYEALSLAENSYFSNALRKLCGYGGDSEAAHSKSMKSLMEAYAGPFRNTLTGRLLAITEKTTLMQPRSIRNSCCRIKKDNFSFLI